MRYRRLEADDKSGPVDPGLFAFGAGIDFAPDGFPIGLLGARMEVESETSFLDLEVGKEIPVAVGRLQIYGGLTYVEIQRDTAIIYDACGCAPVAFLLGNDFRGIGPKAGVRGGVPLNAAVGFVGGASAAALFGTSKFTSRVDDPLSPPFAFQAKDDRIVAVLDAEAGLAFAMGPGALMLGYRIDAVIGALDTDQRVSELFLTAGLPAIGDRRDDFVAHGPFARSTLPLAGLSD